jgi:hypothetical protein
VEHDASRACANAVQRDFFSHAHASSSRSKQLTDLGRALEEHQILLCLQQTYLEVQEVMLAEELEHVLHPLNQWTC